jgi:hypothetical protein
MSFTKGHDGRILTSENRAGSTISYSWIAAHVVCEPCKTHCTKY